MTSYELVVVVHVLSAVLLVGGGLLAAPALNAAIRSAESVPELRRWLNVSRPLDRITPLSSIVLLGSGIYLASTGDWWAESWVQVAIALWVVNTLVATTVARPAATRLARLVASAEGEEIGGDLDAARTSSAVAFAHRFLVANDLGVLFLMIVKPIGYLGSVAAIVGAHIFLLAATGASRLALVGRSAGRGGSLPTPSGEEGLRP